MYSCLVERLVAAIQQKKSMNTVLKKEKHKMILNQDSKEQQQVHLMIHTPLLKELKVSFTF